jgi:carbon starvation protein
VPTIWLLVCTLTAGWQKIFHSDPKIGFLTHAAKYSDAIARGEVLAPARSMDQMRQIVFNDYVDAALAGIFMVVVVSVLVFGIRTIISARGANRPSTQETPFESLPSSAMPQG